VKLKKIIQYRRWKEEWSQKELATKKQVLAIEANKLRALGEKKAEGQNDFLQWQHGNISPELLKLYANFIRGITSKYRMQKEEVEKAEAQVEEKRLDLLKRSQERKVIEKLKEKVDEEARRAQDKMEQQFLDEISLQYRGLVKG
jgi:flagellar FliJ protein